MNTKNGIPIKDTMTAKPSVVLIFDAENVDVPNWYKRILAYIYSTGVVKKRPYHSSLDVMAMYSIHNESYAFYRENQNIKRVTTQSKEPDAADDLIIEWLMKQPQKRYKKYLFATNDKLLIERLLKLALEHDKYISILYTNKAMKPECEKLKTHYHIPKEIS